MNVNVLKMLSCAAVIVCLTLVSAGVASAQTDVFSVNYFANNVSSSTAATVRIDNPGLTYGNLCAMIYVFDQDQQLSECCGCSAGHNGLRTISVKALTNNPLTGHISNTGVIKIVSAAVNNSPCDPTANVSPKPNLRAWATHIQNNGAVTETEFLDSTLGATELANLQAQCAFIGILGSGAGSCAAACVGTGY